MKLHTIRGGTREKLHNKEYIIGIGISLGNKWFTLENICGLAQWALENSTSDVVVFVADSIHAINIEVRNRKSPTASLRRALKKGASTLDKSREYLKEKLSESDFSRIRFCHWADLETTKYLHKAALLQEKYTTDRAFQKFITTIVKKNIKNEDKKFSEADILKLGSYIVAELPELIGCFPIGGFYYNASIYPVDSALTQGVEKIQNGELFPEIRDIIDSKEPKVFLGVS